MQDLLVLWRTFKAHSFVDTETVHITMGVQCVRCVSSTQLHFHQERLPRFGYGVRSSRFRIEHSRQRLTVNGVEQAHVQLQVFRQRHAV